MQIIIWLRTNGVNTNGAAATSNIHVDSLGEKGTPWHFWKIDVGQREYPKGPSVNKFEICSDPISADPILSLSE